MVIFGDSKDGVITKCENNIDNHDDYFMKSISDVLIDTSEIPGGSVIGSNVNTSNDANDNERYEDCNEDMFDNDDGYNHKIMNSDTCDRRYENEYVEEDWNNEDENPQLDSCTLSEKRGMAKRKLRTPMKKSFKVDNKPLSYFLKCDNKSSKNNRSSSVKKRMSQRCAVKNIKKLKPVSKILSLNNEALKMSNNHSTILGSDKADKKTNDCHEDFSNDDDDDDDEEENIEKNGCTSSNRKLMEGYLWKCTDCSAELKTLSALKDHHQVVHKQPPNFKCSHCTKVYTRYRSFARHVKLHGNPKKFSCEVCGKSFSQKTVLQSHRTVHSEERPHVCPQCGKAFKQFSSLYLHSKCHLPEEAKPKFACTVCPKEFSTKHTLETHIKIHTGERNYICDICGKSFIAKGSLDYHILAHSDSKPYNCSVCNKGFKTVRLLNKHSTLHTGIKPHQCDVCGKQFRERSALKEHNRIHTGAMPYSCEYCGKLFRFKGILTVHRRQHTGERPYSCQDCRRDFTNWANYNKHMKRRHRNPENSQSEGINPADRLIVTQDIQTQTPPTSEQSDEQPLQQPSQQCSPHVVAVVPQQQLDPQIPPPISVQQLPPIPGIQLHVQQPVIFNDSTTMMSNNDSSSFKLVPDDHMNNVNSDIYRVTHYVPTHAISGMSYYIPPIHQPILPTRNQ